MGNNREFFLNEKWTCAEGMYELMPEGGSFQIGFYHARCNFANYKGIYLGVSPPDIVADSLENGTMIEETFVCQNENCKEEFTFISENKNRGCEIYEADGKIPDRDIFYRNREQFNSLDDEVLD